MIAQIQAKDLRELRRRLKAVGAFDRTELPSILKLGFMLAVTGGLMTLQWSAGGWAFWLLMPAVAFFITSAVMVGHEGGHGSFSTKRWRNEAMLYFCFPFIGGQSALYWKHKHNVIHHAHPNIDGKDHDLEFWPMAGTKSQYEASGPGRKFMQRHFQGYVFWPLASLLSVSMHLSSFDYLFRQVKNPGRSMAWWVDLAALIGHYALWVVLPGMLAGFGIAIAAYMVVWGFVSIFLSAVFVPAHLGLPILKSHPDTWRLQLETTRNLKMPAWLSFFFIGLDYQVEHHMFPRMSHLKMATASPVVREWSEERGLPYQTIDYWQGLVDATRYVNNAWKTDLVVAEPSAPGASDAAGDGSGPVAAQAA